MGANETNRPDSGRGLSALEAGQVMEIRIRGAAGSYWTYIRDVMGTVTVWLPEMNHEPVSIAEGALVDLSVTLSDSEILAAEAKVKGSGVEGDKPYIELELNPACVAVEHRRRFLRVAAIVPAHLRRLPDGLTPWGEAVEARTVNLSPGGLTLESKSAFTQGEQLSVELELPDCRVRAVALVLESFGSIGGLSRLAVRFTCISDAAEAGITRLMYQYQRMHGAARA